MLTGELRGQIDALWNAFWTGGIANPLEIIEQITYLLFVRGLDDLHTRAENKARTPAASRKKDDKTSVTPMLPTLFSEAGSTYEEMALASANSAASKEEDNSTVGQILKWLKGKEWKDDAKPENPPAD